MFDIEKQVEHWHKGAEEAWEAALDLIRAQRILFGLFFVHLALEKILKAHIWHVKREAPPRIHNLIRLAELAELPLSADHRAVLAEINEFNIEGRYSDVYLPPPTQGEAEYYVRRAEGVFQWLKSLL